MGCARSSSSSIAGVGVAHAQSGGVNSASTWAGTWRAGPTSVAVSVGSWGPDCPARPTSHTLPATGTVSIRTDGDALLFSTGERTDRCWSDNRDLRRTSARFSGGRWETACRTSSRDSRRETGRYTLRGNGADRLLFTDQTEYDWQLNESRCTATVRRLRTYERREATGRPTSEEPPPCTPGAPAQLRIAPRGAELEPGERARFRVRVTDEQGCPVRDVRPTWHLRAPPGRQATLVRGVFTAGSSAAESEGRFRVGAQWETLLDEVEVSVAPIDLRDLTAAGTLPGRDETEVAPGSGDGGGARSTSGLGVSSNEEPNRWLIWGALAVLALAIMALVLAIALLRRRKTSGETPDSAVEVTDVTDVTEASREPGDRVRGISDLSHVPSRVCPQRETLSRPRRRACTLRTVRRAPKTARRDGPEGLPHMRCVLYRSHPVLCQGRGRTRPRQLSFRPADITRRGGTTRQAALRTQFPARFGVFQNIERRGSLIGSRRGRYHSGYPGSGVRHRTGAPATFAALLRGMRV